MQSVLLMHKTAMITPVRYALSAVTIPILQEYWRGLDFPGLRRGLRICGDSWSISSRKVSLEEMRYEAAS